MRERPDLYRAALPYFGSVALWRHALARGGFAFLAAEHYQRRSQRNRCRIVGPNGVHTLSVPLRAGKHEAQAITRVAISYEPDWQRVHWGAIRAGYGSAPFWTEYAPALEALYAQRPALLWDWNWACVTWVAERLGVPAVLAKADDWNDADATQVPLVSPEPHIPYAQVFADRHGFLADLSVLDLLLCQGPAAGGYLTAPGA